MRREPDILKKRYDVFCTGRIVLDIYLDNITQKDTRGNFFLAEGQTFFLGGTAANTAFVLKKLEASPALSGAVGSDFFGAVLTKKLKKNGLNSVSLHKMNVQTSTSFITIDKKGEPKFIHIEGANQYFEPQQINLNILRKSKHLHIGGIFLLPQFDNGDVKNLIRFVKRRGITISADTSHNLSNTKLLRNYPYLDILFINLEEAMAVAKTTAIGKMIPFFQYNFNFKTVVIKMGKKGCIVISKNKYNLYKGFKIRPLDQCGAGDSFVAGYLYGLTNKWNEENTARFANACGALTCLYMGATNKSFTKRKVISFFNLKGIEETK